MHTQHFGTRADGHDHFFQCAVARSFANAVDGSFDLTCTGLHRGNGVGDRHAQIVMTVHGNNGFIDVRHAFVQIGDDATKLIRRGVTDGVGNINGGGTGLDGGFNDAAQIV